MKKKNITTEELAVMIKKGFDDVLERTATKSDIGKRFDMVDERLEKIEKLILADHKRRIERLEADIKQMKDLLAV